MFNFPWPLSNVMLKLQSVILLKQLELKYCYLNCLLLLCFCFSCTDL